MSGENPVNGMYPPSREALVEGLKLYVVTDEREDGDTLIDVVREAILGGATAIQLRRKAELGRRFVELGLAMRRITREAGVLFLVNDRVDVALLTDADGVHVGQDDIACTDARVLMGHKIVGVSAETLEEARQAERDGADYLGVGAVYPTKSKPDAGFTGLGGLREIAAAVQIPVVAIGGITIDNCRETLAHGAHGAAVVSAVMSADKPREAAAEFARKLGVSRRH